MRRGDVGQPNILVPLPEIFSLPTVWSHRGNSRVTRCQEMATLPAGYIPQHKVPSASSSGKLDFIVCEML